MSMAASARYHLLTNPATGGTPISLSVPGDKSKGVYTFTQLQDAADVDKYLRENEVQNAVVVGGAYDGVTFRNLGRKPVTVTQPTAEQLDRHGSDVEDSRQQHRELLAEVGRDGRQRHDRLQDAHDHHAASIESGV